MMSTTAEKPATTPIPVQLSDREFAALIFPHLSRPKRGPKCQLGNHGVLNLLLWVWYTGRPWQCLPLPQDAQGQPAIPDTTVDTGFANWADDGSRGHAFVASVARRADEKTRDLRVLHGDGTHTVAQKGGMGLGTRGPNTRRARKSSRSRTTMAMCELPFR
jgi:transposase